MVRKLEIGDEYFNYSDEKINLIRQYNEDVWVDENNFEHNENGLPSCIDFEEDGKTIYFKSYCVHGKQHNLFGSALIWYDENGVIYNEQFYINGIE